eukprot:963576_1
MYNRFPDGIPETQMSAGFKANVLDLRASLREQLREPFTYRDMPMSGDNACSLLRRVVQFVNQGNFSVTGLWESMQGDLLKRWFESATKTLASLLSALRDRLPFHDMA